MTLALDHIIFGNGRGLKSPYFDSKFYWLDGQLYHWIGGLGAQLGSFQWFMPKPGERRRLAGHEFVVFHASRRWCRIDVSWALVRLPDGINEAQGMIQDLKRDLDSL